MEFNKLEHCAICSTVEGRLNALSGFRDDSFDAAISVSPAGSDPQSRHMYDLLTRIVRDGGNIIDVASQMDEVSVRWLIEGFTVKGDTIFDPVCNFDEETGEPLVALSALKMGRNYVGLNCDKESAQEIADYLRDLEDDLWESELPDDACPVDENFLTEVKGIGPSTAVDLWEHFDGSVLDILTADAETLQEVSGIGESTSQKIETEIEEAFG